MMMPTMYYWGRNPTTGTAPLTSYRQKLVSGLYAKEKESQEHTTKKKKEKYWNSDIKGSRAKRRRLSTQMQEWKDLSTTIALVISIISYNVCFKSNHTFQIQ